MVPPRRCLQPWAKATGAVPALLRASSDVGRPSSTQQLTGCSRQCSWGAATLCPKSLQSSPGRQPDTHEVPFMIQERALQGALGTG